MHKSVRVAKVAAVAAALVVALSPGAAPASPLCVLEAKQPSMTSLHFVIATGGDDLRGGSDNIGLSLRGGRSGAWVGIPMRGGINGGARWADWTTHTFDLPLTGCPWPRDAINGIRLTASFRGGIAGDNWNMRSIRVEWIGFIGTTATPARGLLFEESRPRRDAYVRRFTGDERVWEHDVPPS